MGKNVSRPVSRVLYGPCPRGQERGGHSSWTHVAMRLTQPTRTAGRKQPSGFPPRRPYSVLLPVGFAVPPLLPGARWALTPPFHPYPRKPVPRGTGSRGGLLSVALSLGSPPPAINRHRVSVQPGLSSPAAFRRMRVRPPGRLTARIKGFFPRNANKKHGRPLRSARSGQARSDQAGVAAAAIWIFTLLQ